MSQSDILRQSPLILLGAFGSGKTEIAMSLCCRAAQEGSHPVRLVDLDLVTPFFRSRDARDAMAARGVEVIYPGTFHQGVELPVMPPAIIEQLGSADYGVLDVGGSDMGTRVLAGLAGALESLGACAVIVVNSFRPMTSTLEQIRGSVRSLEAVGRVSLQGMIANPNLGHQTTLADVEAGLTLIREASYQLELPVVGVGIGKHLMEDQGRSRLETQLGLSEAEGIIVESLLRPVWQ